MFADGCGIAIAPAYADGIEITNCFGGSAPSSASPNGGRATIPAATCQARVMLRRKRNSPRVIANG
jgi:hypothetical protein